MNVMTITRLPIAAPLADYLLDPAHRFDVVSVPEYNPDTGTATLDGYARFTRRFGPGKGAVSVDVYANGTVVLRHLGRHFWIVRFESSGNRISAAPVPAAVIVAAIRAALEE